MPPILEVTGISKRFQATQALCDVDFSVEPGEVHALMGENGAGKSTLAKIIAGVVTPDSGEIRMQGEIVRIDSPSRAQELGIGMVFQELDLFAHLTVAENMAIGNRGIDEGFFTEPRKLSAWCAPFLDRVKLSVDPQTPLKELSIGQVQLVAIARALSMNARVILMDEPTSSLSDDSVEALFALIAELKSQGISIVYVSHKMAEVLRISDRVTVLRDGKLVGCRPARDLGLDDLIAMMVGRKLERRERTGHVRCGETLLEVSGLRTDYLSGVDFQLCPGEVLGIAGLVGAGRSELGAALFGLRRLRGGEVLLRGSRFAPANPQEAIAQGFCLLPEDRRWQGIFPHMSLTDNATVSVLMQHRRHGLLSSASQRSATDAYRSQLGVAAPAETFITALSGGNQQKIVLARWLMAKPAVLFMDEPTRGIDVGAKEQIYGIVEQLAAEGKGIILVSSELPELFRCCDRILVMREGHQAGVLRTEETTQEEILALAIGCARQLASA